jgi:hypothetical protein
VPERRRDASDRQTTTASSAFGAGFVGHHWIFAEVIGEAPATTANDC